MSSQRSFWMEVMLDTGSMRVTSSTDTSGIHCMQVAWHHRPELDAGFRAPPDTGHRQHCGAGAPSSCGTQCGKVSYQAMIRNSVRRGMASQSHQGLAHA